MLTVECLRDTVTSGARTYPVYVGFLSAEKIALVAEAPSFQTTTPHEVIATNIAHEPVRDWQRPVDSGRVDGIAKTFDNSGSLMPNPVLLGQNAFVPGRIHISAKSLNNGGTLTGSWEVQIDDSVLTPGQRPLWILDGQHRIAGLSKSLQKANPVPVVFLIDDEAQAYTSPLLASLFAQVTTSAVKLDDLHNEWLTFAFGLDAYDGSRPNAATYRKAFEAVACLCRTPEYGGKANPFYSNVQFNQHLTVSPSHGGFLYRCTVLKDLLYRYYFNQPSPISHLDPSDLATQLALAYDALHAVIGAQHDTVFFGPTSKQQVIMQDAFFIGVCRRVLKKGPESDWRTLLQSLRFHDTNWDFSWVRSLSGPANTASKYIAVAVLSDALESGTLPAGTANLADYFKGDGAKVQVEFSALTDAGRPKKAGRIENEVLCGSKKSQSAVHLPHIKVRNMTSNIGRLEIHDATKRGRPVVYKEILGRGLVLAGDLPNPLDLMFIMSHYGDLHNQAELQVTW